MSHKANRWLADLDPASLSNSEFRILFHLCDCHNPSAGCYPSQEYLLRATGVSNGTLNNALKAMEGRGLVRRERRFDGRTKKQLSTLYVLGFELSDPEEPSPETGYGPTPDIGDGPTPKTGDGADSKKTAIPSPKNGRSRLQPTGDEPVKNQKGTRRALPPGGKTLEGAAHFWAAKIADPEAYVPPSAVSLALAEFMLREGLVGREALRQRGIDLPAVPA
ncbi:MAG: hypothetical protein CMH12_03260 [Maritimibacter sp.]|nr:hypothetical protein [Maritimibacter sp.]